MQGVPSDREGSQRGRASSSRDGKPAHKDTQSFHSVPQIADRKCFFGTRRILFFRWWENPVSASGFSSSPTDFPVALMGTAVSVGATFMSPACVRHCVPPFFIRACGNRRQRRGDIYVARVGALSCCVGVRHVRSVAFVPPAWTPSWHDDVCLSAPVPGVINGAPTGYAAVRS